MGKAWHYAKEGRVVGPLTWEELSALAAAGQVHPDAHVWRDGETPCAAKNVPELPLPLSLDEGTDDPQPRWSLRAWWKRPSVQSLAVVLGGIAVASTQALNQPPEPQQTPPPAVNRAREVGLTTTLEKRLVPKPTPAPKVDAKAHFDRGAELLRQKQYDRAVEEFTAALQAQPDNAEAYYNRALAHEEAKRFDEALADLNQSARLFPAHPFTLFQRGQVLSRLERFAEAITDFNETHRLTPPDWQFRLLLLYERARAHLFNRSYPDAIADCNAMVKMAPNTAEAYLIRGQATEAAGDPDAALPDYRQAYRLDPKLYRAARAEWRTLPENP